MPNQGFQIDRSIAVVGMMGAGKSTIGRRLAERLDLTFIDSDDEIERATGMQISEIFRHFGETWFREKERQLIAGLSADPPIVIATGGGAFADESIRRTLIERCLTIWLDPPITRTVERVERDRKRPLLDESDRFATMVRLATLRRPFYAMAHLHIDNDGDSPDRVVDRIVEAIAGSWP